MAPQVEIDDDILDELKRHAEPFVDTPSTVLRRLLGLGASNGAGDSPTHAGPREHPEAGHRRGRSSKSPGSRSKAPRMPRAKTGTILSEDEYDVPILEILADHGGRAPSREVLDELETRLGGKLTPVDRSELATGDVRWRNRAQFVRLRLVKQGDMVADSPRGVWELSEQGRERLRREGSS